MSADMWLETDTGGEQPAVVTEWFNVTYNLSAMLGAAGYPGHRSMVGAPASEAGGVFRSVADRLKADPSAFDEYVPSNGWGDHAGAVQFCDDMSAACAAHPKAVIGAWL